MTKTEKAAQKYDHDEIKWLDCGLAASTKRAIDCERACHGLSQDALDGGWKAMELAAYARRLEDALRGLGRAYSWTKGVCYDNCFVRGHKLHSPQCDAAREAMEKCGVYP